MTYPIDTISIHNGATEFVVPVTDSAERSHSLQQHNYVKLVWKSADNTPIVANAYIDFEGERFYAVDDYYPTHKNGIYEYEIEFHSIEDTFNRPIFFRHVEVYDQATDTTTTWKEAEWSLNGNIATIGNIIINSLNKCSYNAEFVLYPSDTYKDTPLKSYSFSGTSISDALAMIAEENEMEWWVENIGLFNSDNQPIYYLHFGRCENGDTLTLSDEYENIAGVWQSKGLKSVSQSSNTNIIPQKLYVYGSDRNIIKKTVEEQTEGGAMNVSYDKRLRLPKLSGLDAIYQNIALGLKATVNEDSSITIAGINNHFEQVKFFDEVYPKMTMEVEEVFVQNPNSENPIYWMSADKLKSLVVEPANQDKVNPGKLGLLIEGCTLMCTFTSGLLNGREFECAWEESTARIGLVPIDEDDVQIPFGAYIPKAGDTFILWNLEMPKSVVEDAQRELLSEAIRYIEEIFTSTTETECISEAEAFRLNGYTDLIKVGQRIKVTSNVFRNGALLSRVIKYSYKLTKPYDVNFTLASSRQVGRFAKLENMIADATQEVHSVGQVQRAISRRQWHDTEEMMQMLDSIQKQMVVVGDEQNAFVTSCQVDWDNATKLLKVYAGYLEHQTYKPNNGDGAWSINQSQISLAGYSAETPYYVFFACPKSSSVGEIGFNIGLPQDGDYYFFVLGILSGEYEGIRVFNQSSGLTRLAGGTITTEVIQDATRQLIIDFTQKKIIARKGATIQGIIKFEKGEGENDLGTTIDNLLGGIKGGGINLITGSVSGKDWFTKAGVFEINNGEFCLKNTTGDVTDAGMLFSPKNLVIKAGEPYTLSFEMRASSNIGYAQVRLVNFTSENSYEVNTTPEYIEIKNEELSTEWTKYVFTFIQLKDTTQGCIRFDNDRITGNTPSELWIRKVKLEKGTIATEWCLAQEDLQEDINSLSVIVDGLNEATGALRNALNGTTEVNGGLILSNLIGMKGGNDAIINAGISGLDNWDKLRFWAGSSLDGANTALFRVYDDGRVFGTRFYGFKSAIKIDSTNLANYKSNNAIDLTKTGDLIYLDRSLISGDSQYENELIVSPINLSFPTNIEDYIGSTVTIINPERIPVNVKCGNILDPEFITIKNCFSTSHGKTEYTGLNSGGCVTRVYTLRLKSFGDTEGSLPLYTYNYIESGNGTCSVENKVGSGYRSKYAIQTYKLMVTPYICLSTDQNKTKLQFFGDTIQKTYYNGGELTTRIYQRAAFWVLESELTSLE